MKTLFGALHFVVILILCAHLGHALGADFTVHFVDHKRNASPPDLEACVSNTVRLLQSAKIDNTAAGDTKFTPSSQLELATGWQPALQCDSFVHVTFTPPRMIEVAALGRKREVKPISEILIALPYLQWPGVQAKSGTNVLSFTRYELPALWDFVLTLCTNQTYRGRTMMGYYGPTWLFHLGIDPESFPVEPRPQQGGVPALQSFRCYTNSVPEVRFLGRPPEVFRYQFNVSSNALLKAPEWKPTSDQPPLPARKAASLAADRLRMTVELPDEWKQTRIELSDMGDGRHWIYVVEFTAAPTFESLKPTPDAQDSTGYDFPWIYIPRFRIPVLMDGTIPKIEILP
jgi:hypothetical protein